MLPPDEILFHISETDDQIIASNYPDLDQKGLEVLKGELKQEHEEFVKLAKRVDLAKYFAQAKICALEKESRGTRI